MEAGGALKLIRFYGFRGLRIARGKGQYVWDVDGTKYLDCHAGHGAAFLGHSREEIVKAMVRQSEEIISLSSSFSTPALEDAIDSFTRIAPGWSKEVVFMNTGTEAVETALKAAWRYTRREKVVSFVGGFHGRTLGSLSATWNPKYRAGYPIPKVATFLRFNTDPSEISGKIPRDTAAIIVEPVQGEAGVIPAREEFLKALREEADRVGALLVFDEIQTGFGRTGRIWAHQHYAVEPDIITVGKSIAGGIPASAVLSREEILSKLSGGGHGSTHAANPLAMAAVAEASRILVRERVWESASTKGWELAKVLQSEVGGLRVVREIRGLGLMLSVDLRVDPTRVIRCLQMEERVLALKGGATAVRLLPPYLISYRDIRWVSLGINNCICREFGC